MMINPLPLTTTILQYNLTLSEEGVLRTSQSSQFQGPVREDIIGARLWQLELHLHARTYAEDRVLTTFLQHLAGKEFQLPHSRLPDMGITPHPLLRISASEIIGERRLYTLGSGAADASWVGKLLEINGRSVMVAAQSGTAFEAYPIVPDPVFPYTPPMAGKFTLRPAAPTFAMLTTTATGMQPFILDAIESP